MVTAERVLGFVPEPIRTLSRLAAEASELAGVEAVVDDDGCRIHFRLVGPEGRSAHFTATPERAETYAILRWVHLPSRRVFADTLPHLIEQVWLLVFGEVAPWTEKAGAT